MKAGGAACLRCFSESVRLSGKAHEVSKRVLVFPGGMPRALAFLEHAQAEGRSVVGSSSLGHDPAREHYPLWVRLPFVTAPDFDEALRKAIADFGIGSIFTPNAVVWNYLNHSIARTFPGVTLVNSSPVENEVSPYRKALEFGDGLRREPLPLTADGNPQAAVDALEASALFRHAETIPGMCDHEKIRALFEIFRYSQQGDVVEIGSWWGKSAFILLRLASLYGTGKLLCVDPWSNDCLVQNDEGGLVDQVPVDADEALRIFQLNLLPYAGGSLNTLRQPSVDGAAHYRAGSVIETEVFGRTLYQGKISILHIDGNHSFEAVRADVDAWADMVMPGGWIILDDYVWPYGDGPKRVGDAYLRDHSARIAAAFVMGSALFIQVR